MSTVPSDRLSARAAAAYLCVSLSTLAKWRSRRIGPPFHRCGPRIIYYLRAELDTWLAECDGADGRERLDP